MTIKAVQCFDQKAEFTLISRGDPMEELSIITREEPGIAEIENFDEIKSYLSNHLDDYRNLVYSEDSVKAAKADKASLKKLRKALDDRRKEIKAIYMAPYLQIEAQIKELISMIDEPLWKIDSFVREMEEAEKQQKLEEIQSWYNSASDCLGDLAQKVFGAPGFLDPKWLNKSTKTTVWQSELKERINKAASDISAIQSSAGSFTAAVLTKYLDGMDLEVAKAYKRELDANTAIADTSVQTSHEDDQVIGFKILKVYGTQRQMEQVLDQLDLMGMEYDELEDGMPQPMTELTEPDFNSFVAFDIETSGTFGADNGDAPAEITEIGAVKVKDGVITERFDMLCNPGRPIVPRIAQLTGITDAMVASEPPISEVIRAFADYVGDLPLVGHNIRSSDLHYISRAAKKAGVPMNNSFFDTYLYAKKLKVRYGWDNVKLEYLSEVFGIEHAEAHRAWCDAEANVGVYYNLKELR